MFGLNRKASKKRLPAVKRILPMRFHPRLEDLEDRRLLAVLAVTTTLDEFQPAVVTLAHRFGTDGKLSLREAIYLANLNPGPDIVSVPTGTYKITIAGDGEDADATGDFDVLDNLTIQASSSSAKPIIDGNGLDRVFNIPSSHNGISLTLSGLTVTGGIAERAGGDAGNGGGVDAESTGNKLTFTNTTITGNIATSPGSGEGGGVYNLAGDIVLNGSHVDNNHAAANVSGDGGGIYLAGGPAVLSITNKSTVNNNSAYNSGGGIEDLSTNAFTVTDSQVNNNHAGTGGGGALVNSQMITITNSSFTGNTSGGDGAGLDDDFGGTGGVITLTKATFSTNSAVGDGGGMEADDSQVIISGSTFSGNTAGGSGGGIFNAATVSVTNSSFTTNTATGGNGGGIVQGLAGDITIQCSTFTGNSAPNAGIDAQGGAIFAANSMGTNLIDVENSTLKQNSAASDGGAIYANGNKVVVNKSTFDHNTATQGEGGAIDDALGGIVVTDSSFTNNTSKADGGGFSADGGDVSVTRGIISGNIATNGMGGGFAAGQSNTGIVSVIDSTICNNTAGGNGGGFTADGATLTMTGSTVSNNRSGSEGGGIYIVTTGVSPATPTPLNFTPGSLISNSTIGANGARLNGGGIYFNGGGDLSDLNLYNVTIAFNASANGGGVYHDTVGTVYVGNTLIAENTATNGPDVFGAFTERTSGGFGGFNLIGALDGNASGFADGVNGDQVGTIATPIDPKLGPLQNNGGLTQTYALLAGSPAIDKALNSQAPLTDQRGVSRPQPAGGTADIGAYEYQAPVVKKPTPSPPKKGGWW